MSVYATELRNGSRVTPSKAIYLQVCLPIRYTTHVSHICVQCRCIFIHNWSPIAQISATHNPSGHHALIPLRFNRMDLLSRCSAFFVAVIITIYSAVVALRTLLHSEGWELEYNGCLYCCLPYVKGDWLCAPARRTVRRTSERTECHLACIGNLLSLRVTLLVWL